MSVFVEMEIEEKVLAILQAAITGVKVTSSWQQLDEGEVKGEEKPDDTVVVAVAASAPEWDGYLNPVCSIAVTITVAVRREIAPTGAALAAVAAPIAAFVVKHQQDVSLADDFTTESFRCDGFLATGGTPLMFTATTGIWTFTRQFTLRGTVSEES